MPKIDDKLFNNLKYICDLGASMACLIPEKENGRSPHWVYCLEICANMLTSRFMNEYFVDSTIPMNERFPDIREKFKVYYTLHEDDFANDLIYINEEGKKSFNANWIKVDKDEEEEDEDFIDDESEENSEDCENAKESPDCETEKEDKIPKIKFLNRNRGISIKISNVEQRGPYCAEIPLTEMYEAALVLHKRFKDKKRNFPLSVVYGVYQCIIECVPEHNTKMDEICSEIHEKTLNEEKGLQKGIQNAQKYLTPIIKENEEMFGGVFDKVLNGIDEIPDDQVDEIADQAQQFVSAQNSGESGFATCLASLLGDDKDATREEVEEKARQMGITAKNISKMIDPNSATGMTNNELLNSIPKAEETSEIKTSDDIFK